MASRSTGGWSFGLSAEPVKQEELGEATVWAEMFLRPDFEIGETKGFSFLWKVKLPQEAIDPDVDREGVESTVGIKENTAGDFWTDPGKGFEMGSGLGCGEGRGDGEKGGLRGKELGGCGEVSSTVAEGAFAQGSFSCFGKNGRGWEKAGGAAESRAKVGMDLANLGDLLKRGADEISEGLPGVFTKGT